MHYEELAATGDFAPFVERYWRFASDAHDPEHYEHVIVPDGTASVVLVEPPQGDGFMTITGPSSQAVRVPVVRGWHYTGARLRAGVVRAFLGVEPETLTDRLGYLAECLPEIAPVLLQTCGHAPDLAAFIAGFEAVMAPQCRAEGVDTAVVEMARRFNASDGFTPLKHIMSGFSVGERQLRRRFLRETGLTPKVYSRLRRVRRACIDMAYQRPGEGAAISADHGYADQPHFSRELKAVFNMSPRALNAYLYQIRHFNVAELSEPPIA